MINPDELEPQKTKVKPRDFVTMSIGELEEYIAALETEIARADAAITQKQAHKQGVEALFGNVKGE